MDLFDKLSDALKYCLQKDEDPRLFVDFKNGGKSWPQKQQILRRQRLQLAYPIFCTREIVSVARQVL